MARADGACNDSTSFSECSLVHQTEESPPLIFDDLNAANDARPPGLPERFSLVDGCFDPIHRGHVEYFRLAAKLGLPVICNLACDDYIRRRKQREPLLEQGDRAAVIDALEAIAGVHIAYTGTHDALRRLRPAHYVKGKDWDGTLPPVEMAICEEFGIEVVILDCTFGSSTAILEKFVASYGADDVDSSPGRPR